MEQNNAKNVFSRIGFAQLAGLAASILVGRLVITPLVTASNIEKTFETVGPSGLLLMIYVPQLAYLLAYWLFVKPMPIMDWQKESLGFRKTAEIFLMMYAVSGVLNQIGSAITKTSPVGGDPQLEALAKMQTTKLPIGIMIPVIIGPILEELIFRKLMIDRIRGYGEKTAIIFSAVCFGLFHGNLTQFLYAGCAGLFLAYVYCKTGKVLHTMIMHILMNACSSVILLMIPVLENLHSDGAVISIIGLGIMVIVLGLMGISGFILLFRWIKGKKFQFDESMPECIPQGEVLKTVCLNPGVIILFAIEIFGIIASLFNLNIPLR